MRRLKEDEQRDVLGFRLSAELARHEFAVGEPILVRLTTANVTDGALRLTETASMWAFDGTDGKGYEAPLTRLGLRNKGLLPGYGYHGGHRGGYLQAGESVSEFIVLNTVMDLTMHGTYSIRVGRVVSDDQGNWGTVWTPPFEVSVSWKSPPAAALQRTDLAHDQEAVRSLGAQAREIIGALQQLAADGDDTAKWAAGKELKQIEEQMQTPATAEGTAEEPVQPAAQ